MNNSDVMYALKSKHDVLLSIIGKREFHYIDVPMYSNVGDLLIFAGAKKFIESNSLDCKLYASFDNYHFKWADDVECLVFQGGGNLGDLYFGPQNVRHHAVKFFKNKRILILPQTIHFKNESKLEEFRADCIQHPDLHICVRDAKSYEIAQTLTKNVYLVPDMAHALYPIERELKKEKIAVLNFMRNDDEVQGVHKSGVDWDDFLGFHKKVIRKISGVFRITSNVLPFYFVTKAEFYLWNLYSSYLIKKAIIFFSQYEYVNTDRLHGHILSTLLDIPNTVYDNSYGKNKSYMSCWTFPSSIVEANNE